MEPYIKSGAMKNHSYRMGAINNLRGELRGHEIVHDNDDDDDDDDETCRI